MRGAKSVSHHMVSNVSPCLAACRSVILTDLRTPSLSFRGRCGVASSQAIACESFTVSHLARAGDDQPTRTQNGEPDQLGGRETPEFGVWC